MKIYNTGYSTQNPFLTKRKRIDAKYLKTCIKFVLFYSFFRKNNVQQDLFQNNLHTSNNPIWLA